MNKLLLSTVVIAVAGAFASPAALAQRSNEHASMPDINTIVSTKARAEVQAETLSALQATRFNQRSTEHASVPVDIGLVSTLTRAQVAAEATEARRLGLFEGNGESEEALPTLAQLEQIRLAGLRALRGDPTKVAQAK
jgi:hypothetical protein